MLTLLTPVLRHAGQVAGGFMLANGVVAQDGVDLVSGAVVSLGSLAWYLVSAYMARKSATK